MRNPSGDPGPDYRLNPSWRVTHSGQLRVLLSDHVARNAGRGTWVAQPGGSVTAMQIHPQH